MNAYSIISTKLPLPATIVTCGMNKFDFHFHHASNRFDFLLLLPSSISSSTIFSSMDDVVKMQLNYNDTLIGGGFSFKNLNASQHVVLAYHLK